MSGRENVTTPARAAAGSPLPAAGKPPSEDMVWVPGGAFLMGSDRHYPEEAPAHKVSVDGFWMDRHTVTNRAFRRFVDATGHVTLAEKPANSADFADGERQVAGTTAARKQWKKR